jgi:hypothetical protein
MGKKGLFILLALLAVGLAAIAWRTDLEFQGTIWTELFWMITGAIATTLLLESVLERDAAARRRQEDTFAFRTFSGAILTSILEVVEAREEHSKAIVAAALADNVRFAAEASNVQDQLAAYTHVNDERYLQVYLDVSNSLRDLARGYIRLFSSSHEEMVQHYYDLRGLARRWDYRGTLSPQHKAIWENMRPDDPRRAREIDALRNEREAVARLLTDTAKYIAETAHRVSTKPGMPAPG